MDDLDDIIPDVAFEEEEDSRDELISLDESSSQVVKFVDQILVTAFRNGVSDIHIEPSTITRKTNIRFRTDGVCHEYVQVPNAMAPAITSRLKIMAELDIAEKRLPQDGKIKVRRKGVQEFELRMSTMPTAGKFEDTVLRILTRTNSLKLDQIGLNERNLQLLKKLIQRPYGMVLCVGPTGSGKTTTLHAILATINQPGVKIWTVEDPVEITQAGLRQVQVRSKIGLDFARVMRGFLRLDPDIIMIGEMRDKETANIALEAALTGHLVLSTLHTNNAPETLTRLLEMGMNPLNISDAFLGVLAQRLVRRLCANCIEDYRPGEEEFEDLRMDFGRDAFDACRLHLQPQLHDEARPRVRALQRVGIPGPRRDPRAHGGHHRRQDSHQEERQLPRPGAAGCHGRHDHAEAGWYPQDSRRHHHHPRGPTSVRGVNRLRRFNFRSLSIMQSIRQSFKVQQTAADLVHIQSARVPRREAHGLHAATSAG